MRMTIPNPTRERLIEWFQKFEQRINMPLQYKPETLAKRLYGSSFAEVEEFGLSIYRQYVLGQPNANMREIIANTLQNWSARTVSNTQLNGETENG